MYIPVEEIRKEIPPEKYGLRELLLGELYLTPDDGICVKKQSQSLKDGYDCFDAAKKVSEILENHGIRSNVSLGVDEKGLWDIHYFAETDRGVKVDATPLYKMIGASHKSRRNLSREDMDRSQSGFVPLDGLVPLRYQTLTESTKLLSRIGIKNLLYPTEVALYLTLIENENPTQECAITASFNESSVYDILKKSGLTPSHMSMEETMKEFKGLLSDGVVKLSGNAYDLKLHRPGFLEPTIVKANKINPTLKKEVDNDMTVMASLVEKIPFALYD